MMLKKFFNKHHMLLSKYELEQVISEYDAMSMAYLRNPVEGVELMEYVKCIHPNSLTDASSKGRDQWTMIGLVTDCRRQEPWINGLCRLGVGRLVLGTTSFQCFQELRKMVDAKEEAPRVDILLFRQNDKALPILQLCVLVQELQDLDQSQYVMIVDDRVRLDGLDLDRTAHTIKDSDDGILLPHHLICISENGITTKSNALHYEHDGKIYYVSSFDSGFVMDGSTPFYRVMSPLKCVQMNNVLACSVKTFKKLEVMEYTFDVEGSMFYVALDTGKCAFMTAVMAFAMTDKSPVPVSPPSKASTRVAST